MASKSKLAPKIKPSRCFGFATNFPDMVPAKYQPGTQFAGQEFNEYNDGLPEEFRLSPGSYRVEVKTEGDPKKEETITTSFKHTSGPFEGQLIPRDITVKKAGEVVSFTSLHDPKHIKPVRGRPVGQADFASEVLRKFGEYLEAHEGSLMTIPLPEQV